MSVPSFTPRHYGKLQGSTSSKWSCALRGGTNSFVTWSSGCSTDRRHEAIAGSIIGVSTRIRSLICCYVCKYLGRLETSPEEERSRGIPTTRRNKQMYIAYGDHLPRLVCILPNGTKFTHSPVVPCVILHGQACSRLRTLSPVPMDLRSQQLTRRLPDLVDHRHRHRRHLRPRLRPRPRPLKRPPREHA